MSQLQFETPPIAGSTQLQSPCPGIVGTVPGGPVGLPSHPERGPEPPVDQWAPRGSITNRRAHEGGSRHHVVVHAYLPTEEIERLNGPAEPVAAPPVNDRTQLVLAS